MSRGSTMRRSAQRSAGHPVSRKEKLQVALFGLAKIALEPEQAQKTAIDTLYILGFKPKLKKEVPNVESTTT